MLQPAYRTLKNFIPKDHMVLMEDMLADDSASRFTVTGSGTVALLAAQLNGVLQIDTEASADQDTSIALGEVNLAPAKNPYLEVRARIGTALGTAYYKVAIRKDADEVAQIWVDASGNVKVFADGGSSDLVNNVDTTFDVAATEWHTYGVQVRDDGSVIYYLDNVEIYRTAAGVMVTTATPAYDIYVQVEDNSAAQHYFDIDYVFVAQER